MSGPPPPRRAEPVGHAFKIQDAELEPVCTCGTPWPCMKGFRHYIVTAGQTARCGVRLAADLPSTTHYEHVSCPVCLGTVIS